MGELVPPLAGHVAPLVIVVLASVLVVGIVLGLNWWLNKDNVKRLR